MSIPTPLISMAPPVAYSPTPNFPELDDAAFTGVDIFLLDQFSNPSNPLDFDSLDSTSGWLGMGFGVPALDGWGNQFGGTNQHHAQGGWPCG